MFFHFLFLTVNIERKVKTFEDRYAASRRLSQLRAWEEARQLEAAQMPRLF